MKSIREYRKPEYDVNPVFLNRWSPRAMSGEGISEEDLMSLFEAARWAPSANNNQPWRFVFARRDTPHWQPFLDLLVDLNRAWAFRAAALVVVVSKTTFDHNGKFAGGVANRKPRRGHRRGLASGMHVKRGISPLR